MILFSVVANCIQAILRTKIMVDISKKVKGKCEIQVTVKCYSLLELKLEDAIAIINKCAAQE